jgi:MFS family permease
VKAAAASSSLAVYPWREIAACSAVWAAASFLNALFGYAVPGIMAEFSLPVAAIGLILSGSFLFSAMMSATCGILSDRLGHRRMIGACLGLSAVLTGLIAVAPFVWLIGLLRITGTGLGSALAPLTGGLVANLLPAQRRPLGIALVQCGFPLGWALASLVAAPLIAVAGWRAAFLAGVPVLVLALFVRRILPAPKLPEQAGGPPRPRLRLSEFYSGPMGRKAALVAVGFFCYSFSYGGSAFYMPSFLQEVRGYEPAQATLLVGVTYGFGTVGYIAAALVGQTLLDRRQTARLWALLGGIAFTAFIWLPETPLQDLLLFGVTAFFFYGVGAVLFAVATELFPPEIRTTGIALSASLGVNTGFALAPTVTGALVETVGWREAFTLSSAPFLCVTVLCLTLLGAGFAHIDETTGD